MTGASSGIGEATSVALAEEGAAVALVARRRDRLEALAERIGRTGKALVIEADVTDPAQAQGAVARRRWSELGRLDTLVNNAGVMLLGPIVGAPLEEWQRMVNLNLLGLLYCTHAALPHLLAAAESEPRSVADVVNVSSVAGRVARLNSGVYNATKHGVGAFSESLRQEVTARHVRVTLIEPGATATELAFHNRPEILEGMAQTFGGIEIMQAEDIAESIRYAVTQPRRVAVNEILVRPDRTGALRSNGSPSSGARARGRRPWPPHWRVAWAPLTSSSTPSSTSRGGRRAATTTSAPGWRRPRRRRLGRRRQLFGRAGDRLGKSRHRRLVRPALRDRCWGGPSGGPCGG